MVNEGQDIGEEMSEEQMYSSADDATVVCKIRYCSTSFMRI
jgi:hypothetical protein